MNTAGVIVLVPPELETGFRLAGVEAITVSTAPEALETMERLTEAGTGGVIAVYEPFLAEMPDARRAAYEASTFPVVMPLPEGLERHDVESNRARISAMLSRAVGYHITFGEEGSR
jgi:vacuolar-type H+-ATPase subunit F/Vma7